MTSTRIASRITTVKNKQSVSLQLLDLRSSVLIFLVVTMRRPVAGKRMRSEQQ